MAELLLLFAAGPALLARAPSAMVIPGILAGAGVCLALLLRDPSFDRRQLWNAAGARRAWGSMLLRTAVGCLALLLLVMVARPEALCLGGLFFAGGRTLSSTFRL